MSDNTKLFSAALAGARAGSKKNVPLVAAEPFINKAEVGKRLGKRPRTVDQWMKRGILPFYKIGHSVAFRWSEVQAHLARTCQVCRRGR